MNNNLPDYFLHLNTVTRAHTHKYITRFRNNVRQIQLGHVFRRKCLHYEIARIANNTPPNILEKVYTHSFKGFILYIKSHMLKMYPDDCHLENCYICSRQYYNITPSQYLQKLLSFSISVIFMFL